MKKKRILVILGITCIVLAFIWMILSQSSVGPFLLLAGAGGALLANGKVIRGIKGEKRINLNL